MSAEVSITKENLDTLLKELAKEFRKLNGTKTPAEIILVGGAAVIANYGFRELTNDIDANEGLHYSCIGCEALSLTKCF